MFDAPIDDYKQCNKCFQLKHRDAFYKRAGKAARYGDGLMGHCKKCHAQYVRMWQEKHPDRHRELQRRANAKYEAKQKANCEMPKLGIRRLHKGRLKMLGIKLSESERNDIEVAAQKRGCTMSAVVRWALRTECIARGWINDDSPLFL